jgi:hypothetical protein
VVTRSMLSSPTVLRTRSNGRCPGSLSREASVQPFCAPMALVAAYGVAYRAGVLRRGERGFRNNGSVRQLSTTQSPLACARPSAVLTLLRVDEERNAHLLAVPDGNTQRDASLLRMFQ